MKKRISLSLAISTLIIFGITMGYSGNRKSSDLSIPNQEGGNIKYKVTVNTIQNFTFPTCHLLVVMTDWNNRLVAPLQGYVTGTNVYYFSEKGPVTGTRVASFRFMNDLPACDFFARPDQKTGIFYNNVEYPFTLEPLNKSPK